MNPYVCAHEGCALNAVCRGFCGTHYNNALRYWRWRDGRLCSRSKCSEPEQANGLCARHYQGVRSGVKHPGQRLHPPRGLTPRQRVAWYLAAGVIEVPSADGCWRWSGNTARGYGLLRSAGRNAQAHRFVYEAMTGQDAGEHLHHTCHNSLCVNPTHLIPMTKVEHSALHREVRA